MNRDSSGIEPPILVARIPKNRNCELRLLRNRVTYTAVLRGTSDISEEGGIASDARARVSLLLCSCSHDDSPRSAGEMFAATKHQCHLLIAYPSLTRSTQLYLEGRELHSEDCFTPRGRQARPGQATQG